MWNFILGTIPIVLLLGGAAADSSSNSFTPGNYHIGSNVSGTYWVIDGGFFSQYWGYPPAAEAYPENGNPVGTNPSQQFTFAASGSNYTICNVQNGACLTDGGGVVDIGQGTDAWAVTQNGSNWSIQNIRTGKYMGAIPGVSRGNVSMSSSAIAITLARTPTSVAQTNVTTYHDDVRRTGWNPSESILTPSSVRPTTFGLSASVALDDQVDAQPLVVANQMIAGKGIHTVVYVVTENNTVYAIDASTGDILETVNLGVPVPMPLGCYNNGPRVGITSTPTIDVANQTIYVMTYELMAGRPIYQLHALDLQTLQDKAGSPITVSASHSLADGSKFTFNPQVQRQRPALLESSGNIYAAFGSFCDFAPDKSRGWLLGWNAETLSPLSTNELTDTLKIAPAENGGNYFLSSIWMSGYGVAADGDGNLFFVTGNSDPNLNTYMGTTNIQESVVKMPEALTSVLDLFTPSNAFMLDQQDTDYASGGVLVLPDQPGPLPHLAIAAGKDGRLFILNRDNMGRFHNPDIPAHVGIGICWCGQSYYKGSDGVGRVVTSGGQNVETWKINTSLRPAISLEASSPQLAATSQDDGFFTTVSSHGMNPNTAIIWAIGRPTGADNHVTLYAFNATKSGGTLQLLWSGTAGFWPNLGGNANLVPTVANGMVYVASYRQLSIFGLISPTGQTQAELQQPPAVPALKPAGALFWGTIESIHDSRIMLMLRNGELLQVDLSEASAEGTMIEPVIGRKVAVNGKLTEDGVLEARVMWRAKKPKSWGTDIRGGLTP